MISDWLNEAGRKAIEKMGWPEWGHERFDNEGVVQRLRFQDKVASNGLSHWWMETITPVGERECSTRVECPECAALALLRDRAREWLVEHDIDIERTRVVRTEPREFYWVRAETGFSQGPYTDYDAALIAAVLATEKK